MRSKIISIIGTGLLLAACETHDVDCSSGTCGDPIIFKECVKDTVYFGLAKHNLTPEAQVIVKQQADWLKRNDCATATVEGYTCTLGTSAYNMALGARRSNTVAEALRGQGVSNKLSTISYGESRATGPTPENRKAVTVIDENGPDLPGN